MSISFWKCFCGASNRTPICTDFGSSGSSYSLANSWAKSIPDLPTANISSSYDNVFTTSLIGGPSYFSSSKVKSILVTFEFQIKLTPLDTK
jgi:hypothetical protein